MSERRSSEWPLIVFTVGLQLCCGIVLATAVLDQLGAANVMLARRFAISIFPLALVALIGSTLHLGRPFAATRALRNLPHSRLSIEAAITSVFAALSLVYGSCWFGGPASIRIAIGIATALLGIAAVVSSARIYTIPTQPFWNCGWVICSFLGATMLFAGTAAWAMVLESSFYRAFPATLVTQAAMLLLLSSFWMLQWLKRVVSLRYSNPCAPPLVRPTDWASVAGMIFFAGALPIVLAFAPHVPANLRLSMLFAGVIGVAAGRRFMYSIGTSLSRF